MTSAVRDPAPRRALWKRYRAPLITALPAGAVLGMLADLAFSVNTVHGTEQDQLPALFFYASSGAGFALVACIGAVVAVLLDRPRTASSVTPYWRISAGAGGAVFVGALAAGAISSSIAGSWGWYSFYFAIAVVTALIAAAGAGAITAFFQFQHRLLP